MHLENPFLGEVSPDFHNTVMSLITIVIQRMVRPKSIEGRKLTEFGLQCPVKNGPSAGRPKWKDAGGREPARSAKMGLLLDPKMNPPIIRLAGIPKRKQGGKQLPRTRRQMATLSELRANIP